MSQSIASAPLSPLKDRCPEWPRTEVTHAGFRRDAVTQFGRDSHTAGDRYRVSRRGGTGLIRDSFAVTRLSPVWARMRGPLFRTGWSVLPRVVSTLPGVALFGSAQNRPASDPIEFPRSATCALASGGKTVVVARLCPPQATHRPVSRGRPAKERRPGLGGHAPATRAALPRVRRRAG